LLAPDGFNVTLKPRQPGSKGLLSGRRIATVQPSFQRFDEQLRPRAPRSSGDPLQSSAELLGQKELMSNLLRLHESLASAAGCSRLIL
jgi:hypothetical protein